MDIDGRYRAPARGGAARRGPTGGGRGRPCRVGRRVERLDPVDGRSLAGTAPAT